MFVLRAHKLNHATDLSHRRLKRRSHNLYVDRIWTVFGWSPAIRQLLRGVALTCGCMAGAYETWSKDIVLVIDSHAAACHDHRHANHGVIAHGWHAT